MTNDWKMKDCFGMQAEEMLYGEPPARCMECDVFEKCHKITVAACLQAIATDLQLITQNGLATNKLMGFAELDKLAQADMSKKH